MDILSRLENFTRGATLQACNIQTVKQEWSGVSAQKKIKTKNLSLCRQMLVFFWLKIFFRFGNTSIVGFIPVWQALNKDLS